MSNDRSVLSAVAGTILGMAILACATTRGEQKPAKAEPQQRVVRHDGGTCGFVLRRFDGGCSAEFGDTPDGLISGTSDGFAVSRCGAGLRSVCGIQFDCECNVQGDGP